MKEKLKTQKGFIQIPLLIAIIVAIITASGVGAGVILHKQGKSVPLISNIAQVFNREGTESTPEGLEKEGLGQEELEREQSAKKENQPEGIRETEAQLKSQEEIQPKTQSRPQSEITPESQSETQSSEQRDIEPEEKSDPCADINCPDCQYCDSGLCVNYCQGTDNNCGFTNCVNCNNSDGCSGNNYLDYYCSGTSCKYTSDDCSDCSCSCGGYNVEESIANGNCNDGKDNDCDGLTDLADSKCISQSENCHTGSLWSQDYCTPNCKCKAGEGDCNNGADCETGYCAQDVGERYGQSKWVDVCEERPYLKILSPTEGEEWEKGKTHKIKWEYQGPEYIKAFIELLPTEGEKIQINVFRGATYEPSTSDYTASGISISKEEYNWKVPIGLEGGKFYRIKIEGKRMFDKKVVCSDTTDYFKISGKNIPIIRTLSATGLKWDYTNLVGELKTLGGAPSAEVWFKWGENSSCEQETKHYNWTSAGTFSIGLPQLSPNTTYYFRAVAKSGDGIDYGEIKSFITEKRSLPAVSTISASPEFSRVNKATLLGELGDLDDVSGEVWFKWGETSSLEYETTHYTKSSIGTFMETITDLIPYTTYYFRAVARNSRGISYGEKKSFETTGGKPVIKTNPPTNIQSHQATLSGTIIHTGIHTSAKVWFKWGEDVFCRHETPQSKTGTGEIFQKTITELSPNTTYYFRFIAENHINGSTWGKIKSFTTKGE